MKINKSRLISVSMLFGFSLCSLGADAATQSPSSTKITNLYVGDGTLWYVGTQQDVGNCTSAFLVVDTTLPHYKEVFSALLAAQMAQKNVTFFYSDTCEYDGAHRLIKYIRIDN